MTTLAWAETQAEGIIDRFIADESSADLLHLQQMIAEALRRAYYHNIPSTKAAA